MEKATKLTEEEHEAQNVLEHIIDFAQREVDGRGRGPITYEPGTQKVRYAYEKCHCHVNSFLIIPNPPCMPTGHFYLFYGTNSKGRRGVFSDAEGLYALSN